MRLTALGATATGIMLLGGCSGSDNVASAPPPPTMEVAKTGAAAPPELLGAPPSPDASAAPDGLLGAAPTMPAPVGVAPIPAAAPAAAAVKPSNLKTWRRPDGTLVTAMRPIANPKTPRPVRHATAATASAPAPTKIKPAVVAKPAPKPVVPAARVVAAAPPPKAVTPPPVLKPVAPPKAATVLAKAPTPTLPAAAPAAAPAKPLTKLQSLQAAVAPGATRDAVLSTGESLGKGQPGEVSLSLPASLGDMIRAEAAKLGLAKAAKKTTAYATLEGQGYEVTPNGKQTAVVKPGEPTSFAWQVKPGPEANGQLKTQFGAELAGAKPVQTFSLGEIAKRVTPLPAKATAAADSALAKLGLDGDVNVPGLGKTPVKALVGGALVLLAVIILAILSRRAAASRARAEQRRKFRTLTDYGRQDLDGGDAGPTAAPVAFTNPMVAAAGGAAAATAFTVATQDDTPFAAEVADKPEVTAADPFAIEPAPFPAETVTDDRTETLAPVAAEAPVAPVAYVNPMLAAAAAPLAAQAPEVVAEPAAARAVETERTLEPAH